MRKGGTPIRNFDAVVIGGGITGAGIARDLSMRGVKTLLLEKNSFGQATTASSSHMIHGGLRYLMYDRLTTQTTCWDSGNILQIARKNLTRLPILWPVYRGHAHGIETVETLLESYDQFQVMKGGLKHLRLSKEETLSLIPGLKAEGLVGALSFDEWWVNPVELVQKNLESAKKYGAQIEEKREADEFIFQSRKIVGLKSAGEEIYAKIVINAAGPWIDEVSQLAQIRIPLRLQKGTHLVYKEKLIPFGLILQTQDERYVFVIPSPQGTLIGPTDLATKEKPGQIKTSEEEIQYLLKTAAHYLPSFPSRYDSTIVGARPILAQKGNEKLLSRGFEVLDHLKRDGIEGFITIGGGKMSDFRLMAEETSNLACEKLGVQAPCKTALETLDGKPLSPSSFKRPSSTLERFLKAYPRLRETHAFLHLALAFLRHSVYSQKTSSEFTSYYSQLAP